MKKFLFITLLVLLSSCGSSNEVKKKIASVPDVPVEKAPVEMPMKAIEPVMEIEIF